MDLDDVSTEAKRTPKYVLFWHHKGFDSCSLNKLVQIKCLFSASFTMIVEMIVLHFPNFLLLKFYNRTVLWKTQHKMSKVFSTEEKSWNRNIFVNETIQKMRATNCFDIKNYPFVQLNYQYICAPIKLFNVLISLPYLN